jgi:hypothetical protein
MPIAYLDVPQGIHADAKKKMFKSVYEALNEAYPFPPDQKGVYASSSKTSAARRQ